MSGCGEYGTRTSEKKTPCGRKMLRLNSNMMPFAKGYTCDPTGAKIQYFDANTNPFVSKVFF